jgi:hypothetical protein
MKWMRFGCDRIRMSFACILIFDVNARALFFSSAKGKPLRLPVGTRRGLHFAEDQTRDIAHNFDFRVYQQTDGRFSIESQPRSRTCLVADRSAVEAL